MIRQTRILTGMFLSVVCSLHAQNFNHNGDFSKGEKGWKISVLAAEEMAPSEARSLELSEKLLEVANGAAMVDFKAAGHPELKYVSLVNKISSLIPGELYVLAYEAHSTTPSNEIVSCTVGPEGGKKVLFRSGQETLSEKWSKFEHEFEVPSEAVTDDAVLVFQLGRVRDGINIRDVSLRQK